MEVPLRSTQTVDRTLVHKQAVSDVFLTDARELPNGEFLIAGQWPRRHWHFGEPAIKLDPLLIGETLRQACLYLAFSHLGIPQDSFLLIEQVSVTLLVPNVPGHTPVNVRIRAKSGSSEALELPRRITLRTVFRHRDSPVAFTSGAARVLSPETYARLRARRSVPDNRRELSDRQLRVDRSHPVYFDHPSDHVPGLMLIEEALRAPRVVSRTGWNTVRFSAHFRDFVELDTPAGLSVTLDRRLGRRLHRSTISIRQFGRVAAEVTAEFRLRGVRGR